MAIKGIKEVYKAGYAILIMGGPTSHWKHEDSYYKTTDQEGEYIEFVDYEGNESKMKVCKVENLRPSLSS